MGRVLERNARGASAFMSSAEDGPRVTRDAGGAIVNGAGNVKGECYYVYVILNEWRGNFE